MRKCLHITNGDSAIPVMREAGVSGDILPWRDVLHEGPVPANISLHELSLIRAEFIIAGGLGKPDVYASFEERDAQLEDFRSYDEVLLWFEHDLYDQLQILQILDWFDKQDITGCRIGLINHDDYLGCITTDQMAALPDIRIDITDKHLQLAKHCWSAFRSSSPHAWQSLLDEDTSSLPFLQAAILRHLEQFPSVKNGLNRTEQQILEIVKQGEQVPGKVFAANQERDGVVYMGDSTFWRYIGGLMPDDTPLLQVEGQEAFEIPECYPYPESFRKQRLSLTTVGEEVLQGKVNWLNLHQLDRWYGGVHLRPDNIWRWDEKKKTIISE